MGLLETGVMINMTAASVRSELLPAAVVADMYLSSKLPNTLSEEETITANNPFADPGTSNKYCIGGEEWNNYFKEVYGESNVEWTSKETISNTERLKISGWKYPPDDWLYLKYKDLYNNELYYNQANGRGGYADDYKFIKDPKTVYNGECYSDEEIYQWGLEVMKNVYLDGYLVFVEASNGMKFMGYYRNGVISSSNPVSNFD